MTFLVPKLFRDIAAIPYSNTQKEDLIQNAATVAYGVLAAASFALIYSNNTIKPFGTIIYAGSFYLDRQGTLCASGISGTFLTFYFARLFFTKKLAHPALCLGFSFVCAALTWISFEFAGHKYNSWLREQIDNLQKG